MATTGDCGACTSSHHRSGWTRAMKLPRSGEDISFWTTSIIDEDVWWNMDSLGIWLVRTHQTQVLCGSLCGTQIKKRLSWWISSFQRRITRHCAVIGIIMLRLWAGHLIRLLLVEKNLRVKIIKVIKDFKTLVYVPFTVGVLPWHLSCDIRVRVNVTDFTFRCTYRPFLTLNKQNFNWSHDGKIAKLAWIKKKIK